MKKIFTVILIALPGLVPCYPQSSYPGSADTCTTGYTIFVWKSYPPAYQFFPDPLDSLTVYSWDFGDGSSSMEISPVHYYEYSGRYITSLKAEYPNGCTGFASDTLEAIGRDNSCNAMWTAITGMIMAPEIRDDSIPFSPLNRLYYFQDQSRGLVTQWTWNFGDGTVSQEQNPSHVYEKDGIYTVCLEIRTADNCSSSYCNTLYVGMLPDCNLTGTVKDFTGLDGCGLLIVLDNGEVLEPAVIVPDFTLRNGQRVRLAYTPLKDMASICMAGTLARIECIEEIREGDCQASFNHYPLPWVSSLPPLYQFEDLSWGEVVSRVWDFGDGTGSSEEEPMHRYEFSGYYTVSLTITTSSGCMSTCSVTSYFEGANPQPGLCDHFIKLETSMILNGQTCSGTATATLVDQEGYETAVSKYLWSTGETGPSVNNLCPGITYSIMITDTSGCVVTGSFAYGGTLYPDSLFGNWNYQQENMTYVFNLPVFSDSVDCRWDFGDAESASGNTVSHTYSSEENYTVTLTVYDNQGNLLYSQQIPVTPGVTTDMDNHMESPQVYPVPANHELFIKPGYTGAGATRIEILSSGGQVISILQLDKQLHEVIPVDISSLPSGYYMGKLFFGDGKQQNFRFVK
jgi:PKD repeat protein